MARRDEIYWRFGQLISKSRHGDCDARRSSLGDDIGWGVEGMDPGWVFGAVVRQNVVEAALDLQDSINRALVKASFVHVRE